MKFEKSEVWGFEHAIRGMRNPMNSWNKSDSKHNEYGAYCIGKNDLELMQKLIKAGSEHRKFMRQIFVSVDITAPLYWWKEFDTYKIGTVANSTSTMHKLSSKEITIDDFETKYLNENFILKNGAWNYNFNVKDYWKDIIKILNYLIATFNETNDIRVWKLLIQLLPESYIQTRTVTMNYENLITIVNQRKNHKLTEWKIDFIGWVKSLPYADDLIFLEKN